MLYEYEHEAPPIVAESSLRAQHWQVIKKKMASLLKFADECADDISRQNAEADRAILEESERTARQRQTNNANEQAEAP